MSESLEMMCLKQIDLSTCTYVLGNLGLSPMLRVEIITRTAHAMYDEFDHFISCFDQLFSTHVCGVMCWTRLTVSVANVYDVLRNMHEKQMFISALIVKFNANNDPDNFISIHLFQTFNSLQRQLHPPYSYDLYRSIYHFRTNEN